MSANMPTHIRTAAEAKAASKKEQQQQRHIRTAQQRPFEP